MATFWGYHLASFKEIKSRTIWGRHGASFTETQSLRDRKKSFRNFFNVVHNEIVFSPKYDYIKTNIEISSEKRVPVRISRRTKAQSICESQENAIPLGKKLKKLRKLFLRSLINSKRFRLILKESYFGYVTLQWISWISVSRISEPKFWSSNFKTFFNLITWSGLPNVLIFHRETQIRLSETP